MKLEILQDRKLSAWWASLRFVYHYSWS